MMVALNNIITLFNTELLMDDQGLRELEANVVLSARSLFVKGYVPQTRKYFADK